MNAFQEKVWSFKTAQYEVRLLVEPETTRWDGDDASVQEDIDNGNVAWFVATVEVLKGGYVVGRDHLGGCCYQTIAEFYRSHWNSPYDGRNTLTLRAKDRAICHYFPEMVRHAIAEARNTLDGPTKSPIKLWNCV